MKTKYYVLQIHGDVEPELLGPYKTERGRDQRARKERSKMGDPPDGLFKVDAVGPVSVECYTGDELGEN